MGMSKRRGNAIVKCDECGDNQVLQYDDYIKDVSLKDVGIKELREEGRWIWIKVYPHNCVQERKNLASCPEHIDEVLGDLMDDIESQEKVKIYYRYVPETQRDRTLKQKIIDEMMVDSDRQEVIDWVYRKLRDNGLYTEYGEEELRRKIGEKYDEIKGRMDDAKNWE